jgi:hypothetical protein
VLGTLFGEDVAAAAEISRLALWARVEGEGETVDPLALARLRNKPLQAPLARAAEVAAAPAS